MALKLLPLEERGIECRSQPTKKIIPLSCQRSPWMSHWYSHEIIDHWCELLWLSNVYTCRTLASYQYQYFYYQFLFQITRSQSFSDADKLRKWTTTAKPRNRIVENLDSHLYHNYNKKKKIFQSVLKDTKDTFSKIRHCYKIYVLATQAWVMISHHKNNLALIINYWDSRHFVRSFP